jgi:hypothetical protein
MGIDALLEQLYSSIFVVQGRVDQRQIEPRDATAFGKGLQLPQRGYSGCSGLKQRKSKES